MKNNFWNWFAANVLNIIGGFMIGLGIPFGSTIFKSRIEDALILGITGFILASTSYYYKFVKS